MLHITPKEKHLKHQYISLFATVFPRQVRYRNIKGFSSSNRFTYRMNIWAPPALSTAENPTRAI